MSIQQLRGLIDSLTQDIDFVFEGTSGSICPFSRDSISLCYGENEVTVSSVDEAMSTPFIQGKSLNDVCERLII